MGFSPDESHQARVLLSMLHGSLSRYQIAYPFAKKADILHGDYHLPVLCDNKPNCCWLLPAAHLGRKDCAADDGTPFPVSFSCPPARQAAI